MHVIGQVGIVRLRRHGWLVTLLLLHELMVLNGREGLRYTHRHAIALMVLMTIIDRSAATLLKATSAEHAEGRVGDAVAPENGRRRGSTVCCCVSAHFVDFSSDGNWRDGCAVGSQNAAQLEKVRSTPKLAVEVQVQADEQSRSNGISQNYRHLDTRWMRL